MILCFAAVVATTVAFSLNRDEEYSATATLLFRDAQLDQRLFGSGFLEESSDPTREAETNVSLVSLDVVADRTAEKLGKDPAVERLGGLSGDDVQEKVDVTAEGQSDLVSVEATDSRPILAASLANAFADQYIEFRQGADRQKIREAQRLVKQELGELEASGATPAARRSLEQRLEQLTVLGSLQTGNAELVQQAEVPTSPSSSSLAFNTALGAVLGLLLGLALALLLDRIDRRIREPDEIGEIIGRAVLGVVPQSGALPKGGANVEDIPPGEFEAFNIIRANLRYFSAASEVKSILLTSGASGDGKTTVAWNVAAAAASAGAKAVVVEADLRHPVLKQRLKVRAASGLSAVLAGITPLEEAVVQVPINEDRPLRSVDVIFAGAAPPNPIELLESDRMEELLRRLEARYDVVLIDSPPVAAVSDAIPLLTRVDGVLVVARLNQTTRDALSRLVSELEHLNARTLGVVVNGVPSPRRGYGYDYGYAYADPGREPPRRREQQPGDVSAASPPTL